MKRFIIAFAFFAGGAVLASGIDQAGSSKDERQPLRIHQTTPIAYPQALLARGITSGAARIAITMDNTGTLTDVLVVGYTHEEFAESAERALHEWSYEPMRVLGEYTATQAILAINFEAKGVVISIDAGTDLSAHLLSFRRDAGGYAPCSLRNLDGIPAPVAFVEPVYSKELALHGVRGQAVLEFYIDESGSVRVPAVLAADFWELGVLAMEAVRQWRFASPTCKGKPVLVRVRQAFRFGADPE